MRIVKRSEIKNILLDWQSGKLTAQEVHDWAEGIFWPGDMDFEDWDENRNQSASNEVLSSLDNLDIDLLIAQDIPIFLDLLKYSPSDYHIAFYDYDNQRKKIDITSRIADLKNTPPYDKILRNQ